MESTQDTRCGKTFRERFQAIRDTISLPSCARSSKRRTNTDALMYLNLRPKAESSNGGVQEASWEKVSQSHGEFWTLNIGESPKDVSVYTLSQILEDNVPQKYYLSAKACEGILRRAEKRGKKLPPMLWEALIEVVERSICSKTQSQEM